MEEKLRLLRTREEEEGEGGGLIELKPLLIRVTTAFGTKSLKREGGERQDKRDAGRIAIPLQEGRR